MLAEDWPAEPVLDDAGLGGVRPGDDGRPFYTVQRVNGKGKNGKGDDSAGAHRHDLARSDSVKKNSLLRQSLKRAKADRKSQVGQPVSVVSVVGFIYRVNLFIILLFNKHHEASCPWLIQIDHQARQAD